MENMRKDKKSVNYELEKLIKKVERMPIYYNWFDFYIRKRFIKIRLNDLTSLRDSLKRSQVERILMEKREDCLKKIDKLFNPVIEKLGKDILNENDLQRRGSLVEEYNKTGKVAADLKKRVNCWYIVGVKLFCSEHNLSGDQLYYYHPSLGEVEFIYGDEGKKSYNELMKKIYKVKEFRDAVAELRSLEEEYAKYNNGRGLVALEKALKKIEYWQQLHARKAIKEKEEAQRLKEILAEHAENYQSIHSYSKEIENDNLDNRQELNERFANLNFNEAEGERSEEVVKKNDERNRGEAR